jgi:hypothetical protein
LRLSHGLFSAADPSAFSHFLFSAHTGRRTESEESLEASDEEEDEGDDEEEDKGEVQQIRIRILPLDFLVH